MKKKILTLLLGTMFCTNTVSAAVTAIGTGITENAALHEAMRKAVEEETGLAVTSSSSMLNFQVKDKVYTHAEGYIQGYEILERSFDGKWYRVKIKADIKKELKNDLQNRDMRQALIGSNLQDPRIGIAVFDKNGQENVAAENTFISALQTAGFSRITDMKQLEQIKKKRLVNAVFHEQYRLIEALQGTENIDYMVVAGLQDEAVTYNRLPGFGDFKSGQVTMTVKMFNVNNGEILFADSLRATGMHTNAKSAICSAELKLAKTVAAKLASMAILRAANPEQHIQLIVVSDVLGDCSSAQNSLRNMPGVTGLFTRNISYGNMCFDLNYAGTSEDFMNVLADHGISVLEMSAEYIKI